MLAWLRRPRAWAVLLGLVVIFVIVAVERWKEANDDQIAGHKIEVWAEDDGCTQTDHTAIAARRLLARQGLVGVIGPQCSGGADSNGSARQQGVMRNTCRKGASYLQVRELWHPNLTTLLALLA